MWYIAQDTGTAYIAHHGILGQKWGIRRYQNKDGSLTPEGKARAMKGHEEIEKVIRKGESKSANKRISSQIVGNAIKSSLAGGGLAAGTAIGDSVIAPLLESAFVGSAVGPMGIAAGTLAGGILGSTVGGAIRSAVRERGKMKANRIKRQYDNLAESMNEHYNKNNKSSHPVTQKGIEKLSSDKEVARARKTGKYDMEFLEKELDVDERTGELLKGKALDDAYRKYLNSKSAVQDRANYDVKSVRNAPTNKERNEALNGAAREAKRTGVYAEGFKDSSFYINPETGKPLTGKALDSAYKKWLIEQM